LHSKPVLRKAHATWSGPFPEVRLLENGGIPALRDQSTTYHMAVAIVKQISKSEGVLRCPSIIDNNDLI
jgi:hypothetical protein